MDELVSILRDYGEHTVLCPAWLGGIVCDPQDCGVVDALIRGNHNQLMATIQLRCKHTINCTKRSRPGYCSCGLDERLEGAKTKIAIVRRAEIAGRDDAEKRMADLMSRRVAMDERLEQLAKVSQKTAQQVIKLPVASIEGRRFTSMRWWLRTSASAGVGGLIGHLIAHWFGWCS